MEILKSKTGPLKWLCIYEGENHFLLNDADIHQKSFQIGLIKIISLKTLEVFTSENFFKEENGIIV